MNTDFEVIRVRKVKLNQDRETAKVVLDVRVDGKIGKLTIPKLNISSLKLNDETCDIKYYDSESDTLHLTSREVMANMLVDIESDGLAFTIKLH